MDFTNFVTVKSRTGKKIEFMYNGKLHVVDPKKGLHVPRFVAELAISQTAFRWDSGTGLVEEALVYIEDDKGTDAELPSKDVDEAEVAEVKKTDGLGEDSMIIDGKVVKKTAINLKPKKEDFTGNNV